jgi:2-desacetyl-2-hydroxyethyl bacteriochlorophyllide A dehydrogenase
VTETEPEFAAGREDPMRGVVYQDPGRVEVRDLPMPRLEDPRDAIVRVHTAGICGTDLHPYRGAIPGFAPGTVLGHEFAGTIHEVGSEVPFAPGDRVFASDIVACGECGQCEQGRHYQCASVSLFGYSDVVGQPVQGGQAEFVRVPFADVVLYSVPDTVSDDQVVFVGDLLSTAYAAVRNADVTQGGRVAVVGSGALGLLAALCSRVVGAQETVVADPDPRRRAWAAELGFATATPEQIRDLGADSVIEAVGNDGALETALAATGPGATIAVAGSHHSEAAPFRSGLAFARELTIRFTVGDPLNLRAEVLDLLVTGAVDPSVVVSDRLPLSAAAQAYAMFDSHNALKVILNVR